MKVFKRLISTLKEWANTTVNYRRVSPFGVLNVPAVEPVEPVTDNPMPAGEAEQATPVEPLLIPYHKEYEFVNDGLPFIEPITVPAVVEAPAVAPNAPAVDQWQPGVEVSLSTTDTITTTTTTEPAPVQHSIEVFVEAARKPRNRAKKAVEAPATPASELLVPLKAKRKRSPRNKAKKNQPGETK